MSAQDIVGVQDGQDVAAAFQHGKHGDQRPLFQKILSSDSEEEL